ncbi:nuclear transport factor 2 family protein [Roseobacter sp. YSTF-M11]|uniref:Nuclear transport factor 2 family protein n=1 Tax=Roseobacter insulae TaxID=2859783 RepID=A0A9X1FVY4_9RHOB|nr:nuclear transport factor 2 family protein [Roseobacter insulae]MBW4709070.1 nuclear transport factor 2 family protein [Roseobacter insulae]
MKNLLLPILFLLPVSAIADGEGMIRQTIEGIAVAADAQDWDRLDVKFADHVILNQLSLATREGARLDEQSVVDTWADLLPRFDSTHHDISGIEVLGVTSVIAKATATYNATYKLDGQVWQQRGRLDYILKNTDQGWRVTALNTTPEWENRPLSELLSPQVH